MTLSEENHLKAIFHLYNEKKEEVNTNAIAEVMNTKASSVTDMLKRLADKGLINYVKYQGVTLTKKGMQKAIAIISAAYRLLLCLGAIRRYRKGNGLKGRNPACQC